MLKEATGVLEARVVSINVCEYTQPRVTSPIRRRILQKQLKILFLISIYEIDLEEVKW